MKTYTFVIASTDDFDSIEEVHYYLENLSCGNVSGDFVNCSTHEFECPTDCDDELVTMIGRGIAFSNGWCMDDTISFIVEGTIES